MLVPIERPKTMADLDAALRQLLRLGEVRQALKRRSWLHRNEQQGCPLRLMQVRRVVLGHLDRNAEGMERT